MTAANALKDYILSQSKDAVIEIADTLEYVSPFLNKAVTGGYVYMAKNTPTMYGTVYRTSDKNATINKTVEFATNSLKSRLLPLLENFAPDIVITTHAFAAEIVTALKTHGYIDLPVINILTDFAVHQTYISDGVDAYIVSSREMVDAIVERGVDRVRVYPYGIPVKHQFFEEIDRAEALQSEGLDPELPTILIMAGSFGVTDILKIYHKIVKSTADFQIIVITGKNEKLYDTFDRYLRKITLNNTLAEIKEVIRPKSGSLISRHKKPEKPTKLLYFTNEVPKYMHISDMIVTKPGGLTVSEAIASGLPMGIFKAIPGQEEQNADFLVRKNMAVRLEKNNTCTATITDLLEHPEKLAAMKTSIQTFSKGNSSKNIYTLMLELLEKYRRKHESASPFS